MSSKKNHTTHSLTWRHAVTGKTHRVRITHTPNYLHDGHDHIEVQSQPKAQPHPISDTGYRSEFINAEALAAAGGPVAFVTTLFAAAMASKTWRDAQCRRQQGDLFQWAASQSELAKRKRAAQRPKVKAMPKARTGHRP